MSGARAHLWFPVLLLLLRPAGAGDVNWEGALVRIECWPANASAAHVTAAIPVAPDLLATIIVKPGTADSYRAVTRDGTHPIRLLARDDASGFTLLTTPGAAEKIRNAVPLPESSPALPPGTILTLQSSTQDRARLAGRETLHGSRLLECPWLRVHLPRGTWAHGTPLTTAEGALAGLLAGEVPEVTDAARVLPAAAVSHFVKLWNESKTLARAELGIRVSHGDGIPRVVQCYAALPAEQAGIHPGDVLLRIGSTTVQDAVGAADACFYLRVDESISVSVLRGTEVIEILATPVSANARKREPDAK